MTRSVVLLIITRFSVIHCTRLPLKLEITNTEKALNVWRKNAQVLTPIMIPKMSQYIEKVDIFFRRYDTIRYIDIENDISILRYIPLVVTV